MYHMDDNMEIVPRIHNLGGKSVNYYLVEDDGEIILIDTGLPGNSSKIVDYVEKTLKRKPQDIKTIVITHSHFDHVGSLSKIKEITGAQVAIHPADADYVRGKTKHIGGTFINALIKLFQIVYRTKPVEPEIMLKDCDVMSGYQVIHTPGHSPGSICLYNPEKKVIFVGDILQYKNGRLQSPGKKLIPEPEKYGESLRKLLDLDIKIILTGHTAPVTSGGGELLREFVKTF
jgi:glyoxylase-like metal-dependent hydrolase (beta-lactamase superfamily II)